MLVTGSRFSLCQEDNLVKNKNKIKKLVLHIWPRRARKNILCWFLQSGSSLLAAWQLRHFLGNVIYWPSSKENTKGTFPLIVTPREKKLFLLCTGVYLSLVQVLAWNSGHAIQTDQTISSSFIDKDKISSQLEWLFLTGMSFYTILHEKFVEAATETFYFRLTFKFCLQKNSVHWIWELQLFGGCVRSIQWLTIENSHWVCKTKCTQKFGKQIRVTHLQEERSCFLTSEQINRSKATIHHAPVWYRKS